jgi:ribosomal protein L34E
MVKCRICNKRLSGIMNNAAEKLSKLTQNYEDMLAKL